MRMSSWPGLSHEVAVVIVAVWPPILTLSLRADGFDYWVDVGTGSAHPHQYSQGRCCYSRAESSAAEPLYCVSLLRRVVDQVLS